MNASAELLIHAYGEDPHVITGALRVARNAAHRLPDARIRVVVQGRAVTGLISGAGLEDDLAHAGDENIEVTACGNSMERSAVEHSQLTAGVHVVPSAVVHLAERQWAGAAYVRV